jgi:hypothetical protein
MSTDQKKHRSTWSLRYYRLYRRVVRRGLCFSLFGFLFDSPAKRRALSKLHDRSLHSHRHWTLKSNKEPDFLVPLRWTISDVWVAGIYFRHSTGFLFRRPFSEQAVVSPLMSSCRNRGAHWTGLLLGEGGSGGWSFDELEVSDKE